MKNPSPEHESEAIAAARAVRFGFAAVVIGMSYPNIRCALSLYHFEAIFKDMLGNKPLPELTRFVLQGQPVLLAISIAIPLAAIILVFAGRLSLSIYVSGGLILAVFFQLFFTSQAMCAPVLEIVTGMAGTP